MSGVVCIGKGVDVFRLVSIKGQLALEEKGIRSKGGPLRPRLAQEFGLSPRAAHTKYIEAIEKRLEETRAQLEPGDIKEF